MKTIKIGKILPVCALEKMVTHYHENGRPNRYCCVSEKYLYQVMSICNDVLSSSDDIEDKINAREIKEETELMLKKIKSL